MGHAPVFNGQLKISDNKIDERSVSTVPGQQDTPVSALFYEGKGIIGRATAKVQVNLCEQKAKRPEYSGRLLFD